MTIDADTVFRVLLVFVRVGGLLVSAPFFSRPFVPVLVKVMLGVLLAFVLAGFATGPLPAHVDHPVGFVLALGVEAGTGVLLGYGARFVFFAVQTAGEVIGFQMSLSMAQAYSPTADGSAGPIGQILSVTFLLLFLLLDGPAHLVRALAGSFEVIPLGGANLAAGGPLLIQWTGAFFALTLRLAAPFMVALLLLDVALGIFARVVPQADLFAISLPAKLVLGMGAFFVFLQGFVSIAPGLLDRVLYDLADLIGVLVP